MYLNDRYQSLAKHTRHYENVPFEVPESWEWIQIKDVCEVARGGSPRPIKDYLTNDPSGVNWIKIGDTTKDGKYIDSAKEKIKLEGVRKSRIVHKGDFLLTNSMSFGRPYILRIDGCIHDGWLVISPMSNSYQSDFLYYLLSSIFAYEQFSEVASGGVVTNLNSDKVADSFFPLPPYKEQIRIVEEIEKWFALIDTLESAKEDLRTSISQAKSKILDLAIHGKLVLQDPNDEPAIELLKRINPKFTPCDNWHYENVPSNWTAIILGDLCFTINGLWKGKKPPFVNVGVIRNANFTKDCKLDYSNIAYLEVETKQYEKRKLQYGDIIVEKSGGSDNQPVGRTILFEKTDGDYSFSNFTSVLRICDGYPALPEYLNMYLQAVYQTGITKRMQTQTTGIHNLIFDQFLAIPIELPPLVEQRRIINKVNELFQILDNISAEL